MTSTRREAATLALLYGALFAVTGIALPFLPVWLDGLGFGPRVLSLLVALPILVRILATAPLTGLIDRGVPARTISLAGNLALAAGFALMPLVAPAGWPMLALVIALQAVAQAPLVATADFLALRLVRRAPRLAYARIRLGGSVSFLAANLAAGWWLTGRAGGDGVIWLLAGTALLGAAISLALPREAAPRSVTPAPSEPPWGGTAQGRRTALRLAILAAAAAQASHAAPYAFGSIHWRSLGIPSDAIGVFWAVGVVAEILLFTLVAALPSWREDTFRLLALGTGAGILRWPCLALAGDSALAILALQLLHGLTFGATQLGAMAAVSQLAPEGGRGRAQGRLGAAIALASAAATLASGAAVSAGGGALALALMAPLSAAGLVSAFAMRAVLLTDSRRNIVR